MQIDHVYLLNLPHRIDRLENARKQLTEYEYEVIQAVRGETGVMGLKSTLVAVFEDAIENRYNNILIFEDDVEITGTRAQVELAIKELPTNWDTLFLGGNIYMPATRYSESLFKLTGAVGNHAVLYNSNTFQALYHLYKANKNNNTPSDVILDNEIIRKWCGSFVTEQLIAIQSHGYSDIERKTVNYDNLLIERFRQNVPCCR